jgi:autotransporter-associated beta strand protein/parallel beta-helix repeat protein
VAQTYYVGIGGSDSNPGTLAQPYATIQKALNTVTSGGTVDVLSGVYRNQFNTLFASNNVTLQAAPGASVTISGADVLTGWTQVGSSGVYQYSGWTNYFGPAYGSGPAASANRDQLFVNGAYLQEVTSQAAVTPGTFYINPTSQTIYLQLGGNANPNAGTVECTATAGPLLSTNGHSSDVIQGLNFTACANNPQMSNAAVQVSGGSSNIVSNISVKYAAGAGLGVSGTNSQVLNSTFNYNGEEGIAASGATNLLVQNSMTAYNNTLPGKQFDTGWEAGGIKCASGTTNAVINGLISVGNIGSGIWFDIASQNTTIKNCLVNQNGDGIHYEISYGGQIYNNLVSNSKFSRDQIGFNPTTLNPYSPSSQGIYLSSSAYCNVYNNTVVNNDNVGIVSGGSVRGDGSANNYNVFSYGNNLVNNIGSKNSAYQDPASGAGNFFEYSVGDVNAATMTTSSTGSTSTTGNLSPAAPYKFSTSNYNLFQINNHFDSWTYTSFPSWQSGTSQDLNSLATDPLFTNPAAGNYTLQAGSPAIGAGTTGPGWTGMSSTMGANLATVASLPVMTATTYSVSSGSTSAVATALSGTGGLTLTGGGLLILSGANTYQGPTTISGGTLQIAGGFDRLPTISAVTMATGTVLDLNGNPQTIGSLSGSGTVLNSAALTVGTDSTDTTFSGAISGSGDLLKTGVGTLTLAGSNTYSGRTYINAGILQIGNYGSTGSLGPGNVVDNATLMFSLSGTATVANNISGNGNLTQAGLGTLVVTGSSTYTGGTYIDGGTLQLAGGPNRLPAGTEVTIRTGVLDLNGNNQWIGALNNVSTGSGGGSSTVKLGTATLSIGDGTNSSYPYTISGAGSLLLVGSGTVTLSGTNTYSGGTTVSAGNLVLSSASSVPTVGKILIQSGGALDVSGAYSSVTAWLNSNAIHTASAGALALTGNSNENINLAVAGGGAYANISLGSVGANSYSGTLTPAGNTYYLGGGGGTLVMADNGALVNSTSATRSLAINGNVTLSGSNSYGGGTTLNAGTLNIAGDTSLGTAPASPATNLTFAGNATLQAGASSVALAASRNLVINSGVTATLGTNGGSMTVAGAVGGSGGLAIVGGGVLTLSGSSTFSGGVQTNGGTLNLAHPLAVQNSTVNLSPSGGLSFAAGNTSPTLGGLAGAGNVVLATAAAEPVTLNVGNNGQSATYSGNLSGGGGLTKQGSGTLTLTAPSTYNGPTVIAGGVLQLQSAAGGAPQSSAAGAIGIHFIGGYNGATAFSGTGGVVPTSNWNNESGDAFNGTTLLNNSGNNSGATLSLNGATGVWGTGSPNQLLNGYVSVNSYNSMTLTVSNIPYACYSMYVYVGDSSVGDQEKATVNGTTYYYATEGGGPSAYTAITSTSPANYQSGNYVEVDGLTASSQTVKIAGSTQPVGGLCSVEIVNTASTVNTLPATTALSIASGGTLDLGGVSQQVASLSDKTPGNGGSLINSNSAASVLTLSPSGGSTTFSGMIQGGGTLGIISLVMSGSGTQVFAGSNSYTGSTAVNAGTLQATSTAALPGYASTGEITVASGGMLAVSAGGSGWTSANIASLLSSNGSGFASGSALGIDTTPGNLSYASNIAGSMGVAKLGANTLTLSGANTYTGSTAVKAGTLQATSTAALPGYASTGKISVASGGMLAVSAGGSGWASANIASLLSSNGSGFASGSVLGIDTTPGNLSYASNIAGSMGLAKLGGNTLTLTASNTYSGGTTITAGTLQLGDGLSLCGYVAGNITDNSLLSFANPLAQTFVGSISGTGSLTKSATGTLTLSGSNSYSGGTSINAGVLSLANSAALQQSTLDTSGGGAVSFGGLTAATLGGLQGSGGLALNNTAALPVALTVGKSGGSTTFSGALSGSGSLIKVGGGTLTLTGSNNYSGGSTISAGAIAAGGPGTLSPFSDMTVSGGTLDASGYANTVKSLTMTSAGTLDLGIGNLLTCTNAADLGGTLNLSGVPSGSFVELMAYSWETGTFATVTGLPGGHALQYNATELDLVPEPSTLALLAAGALGLAGYAWRRRAGTRGGQQP